MAITNESVQQDAAGAKPNHKGRIHHRYLIKHYEDKHPEVMLRKLDSNHWFKTYLLDSPQNKDEIPGLVAEWSKFLQPTIKASKGNNNLGNFNSSSHNNGNSNSSHNNHNSSSNSLGTHRESKVDFGNTYEGMSLVFGK